MNTKFFTLASIGDAFTSAMENNVLPEVKTIVNTLLPSFCWFP